MEEDEPLNEWMFFTIQYKRIYFSLPIMEGFLYTLAAMIGYSISMLHTND